MTVRTRLTLLYGALFLASSGLLMVVFVSSVHDFLYAETPVTPDAVAAKQGGENAAERFRDELRRRAERGAVLDAAVAVTVVTGLSAAAGALVSGRLLARVRRVTEAARAASESNLSQRLNLPGPPDEIKELGDTFDAMLARMDTGIAAQRRFVANASHELRTPLTVTRTAAEVTLARPGTSAAQLRAMGEAVVTAMIRAERLVDSLLVLTRSEQVLGPPEPDDLAAMAGEIVDHAAGLARERGLRLHAELAPAPVAGDSALLSRAVGNLVENAIRYNAGGEVAIATGIEDGEAWVRVTNTGPDLSAVDIDQLFEPFHRGDRGRPNGDGAGLGLSIVAAVARAHAGSVRARANPPGTGGLTVLLRLPVRL
jgi:signal transduction histidine kinase